MGSKVSTEYFTKPEAHEFEFGKTFKLKVNSSGKKVKWRFNGLTLKTASGLSFSKSNANFQDSGKYECIIGGQWVFVFDVNIYEYIRESEAHEFEFGKTFQLKVNSSGKKVKWRFNGLTLKTASGLSFSKSNANFQDSGKYECIIDDQSVYIFDVKIYDFLFQSEFLGIRKSYIGKTTEEGKGVKSSTVTTVANSKTEWKFVLLHPPQATASQNKLKEYNMSRNPRGIAVIIVIDEFEIPKMNLEGMKTEDTAKLRETFKKLHFKVRECNETKAENILRYLENIADEDHSPYDCFVICFSTHGGNGFVCCSDFQRNYRNETEKGFILFTTLLELFLPNKCKSLSGKPKLFFFDCCRSVDNTLDIGKHQSPIRMFYSKKDEAAHYADTLIGYATVAGGTTRLSNNGGSCYTNILTSCLYYHGAKESLADIMVYVNSCMQNTYNLTAHHESTLTGKIVMKNLIGK